MFFALVRVAVKKKKGGNFVQRGEKLKKKKGCGVHAKKMGSERFWAKIGTISRELVGGGRFVFFLVKKKRGGKAEKKNPYLKSTKGKGRTARGGGCLFDHVVTGKKQTHQGGKRGVRKEVTRGNPDVGGKGSDGNVSPLARCKEGQWLAERGNETQKGGRREKERGRLHRN